MLPPRRYVLRAIAYPAVLGGILFAMKTQDRFADITPYWEKLEEVRALEPDVLFLGSSRTLRHLDPVRLDSLRGDGAVSYNFGLPGSRSLETHFRTDHLLVMDLPVRRMVVEFGPVAVAVPKRLRGTRRVQHHHDARRAMIGSRVALAADRPVVHRVRSAAARWRFWTTNTFLVGWGRAWTNAVVTEQDDAPPASVGRRGHVPLRDDGNAERSVRREQFLTPEGQAEFERRLGALRLRETVVPTARDRVTADAWIALAERGRARGVEMVFVEQVGTEKGAGVTQLVREALGTESVIVLNDPQRYPELFDGDAWFDEGHLGQEMALRATDILAAELPPLPPGSARLGAETVTEAEGGRPPETR
ncbi:MAG: hypothetical protein AAF791_10615 [Bacteroidota bacterium]